MENIFQICKKEEISFSIIAGDLWDRKLWSHSVCFRNTVDWIIRLASLGPVYIIYGTPSHDTPGSLSIFERILTQHPIYVAARPTVWKENIEGDIFDIAALPHIEIAPQGDLAKTITTRQAGVLKLVENLYENCSGKYKIFVGHLAITGCVIPQGTDGYEIDAKFLSRFDYAALGHVHPQNQDLPPNVQYSGSIWHLDTGDVSPKGFNIVTLDKTGVSKKFYNAGSHPVVKFSNTFSETFDLLPIKDDVREAKVRYTMYVPSRFREAFDAEAYKQSILNLGAYECKVIVRILQEDIEVVDFGYTRSVQEGNWLDKFRAYCESVEIEVTDSMLEKVSKLIEEVSLTGIEE